MFGYAVQEGFLGNGGEENTYKETLLKSFKIANYESK